MTRKSQNKHQRIKTFQSLDLDNMMAGAGYGKVQKRNNAEFLPSGTLIAIMAGRTGAGKTHILMDLILTGALDFTRLYWYSLTLDQDKVRFLKDQIDAVEKKTHKKIGHWIASDVELPTPEDLDKTEKNLVIFDDIVNQPQGKIKEYFLRGRHNNAQVFYLTQSYHQVPKGLMRENSNLLILTRGMGARDLREIAQNYSGSISLQEFREFYKQATKTPYGFAAVDSTQPVHDGMFTKSFNEIYIPFE